MKQFGQKGQITVERFNAEGIPIAELPWEGRQKPIPLIVPLGIPGEVIDIQISHKKDKTYWADCENIVSSSPSRVKPRCIHFGECGGCRWQHISYEGQLSFKEQKIRKLFSSLEIEESVFHPIIADQSGFNYRNKMEFSFYEFGPSKEPCLGLIEWGRKQKVANLTECHLCQPWMSVALEKVREWWSEYHLEAHHMSKNSGLLRNLTLREGLRTGQKMAILTISGTEPYPTEEVLDSFCEALLSASVDGKITSIWLASHIAKRGQPTRIEYRLLHGEPHIEEILFYGNREKQKELRLRISPSSFFQPNTAQAEKMYSAALELAKISNTSIVYDLYCGTGTFGIFASAHAKQVYGIELNSQAVEDGYKNIQYNQISNVHLESGDVGEVLKKWREEDSMPKPDLVLLDPPRSGLSPKAIAEVLRLNPPKIAYMSCNPASQALNLQAFVEAGYCITAVQAIDQFAQTAHVENIAILHRVS